MKKLMNRMMTSDRYTLIATFGKARLVETSNGRVELRGGTHADHMVAREWVSLFMHRASLTVIPMN